MKKLSLCILTTIFFSVKSLAQASLLLGMAIGGAMSNNNAVVNRSTQAAGVCMISLKTANPRLNGVYNLNAFTILIVEEETWETDKVCNFWGNKCKADEHSGTRIQTVNDRDFRTVEKPEDVLVKIKKCIMGSPDEHEEHSPCKAMK